MNMTGQFDEEKYGDLDSIVDEIHEIKEFGEELGLIFKGAFSTVDLSEEDVYFVYASYKFMIGSGIGIGFKGRPWEKFSAKSDADEFIKE